MANKKIGRKSSAQDNFLEPSAVTGLVATNVGSGRPYLLTANTTSAASAAGKGGAANLSWTLPAASPPAASYTITSTPATYTVVTGNANTTYLFQGLASATSYTFTVVATNAAGSSVATTSASAPISTVPQSPNATLSTSAAGPTPVPASGQDRITFSANATGGAVITSFQVTSSLRGSLSSSATSPFDTTSPNDETYTVFASNANGQSMGTTTGTIATFTPPHFPPFFPPYFPPFFPPFFPPHFPPFFPPHFPPFFPPFFPPYFPPFFPPHFPPFFPPFFPPHFVGGSTCGYGCNHW